MDGRVAHPPLPARVADRLRGFFTPREASGGRLTTGRALVVVAGFSLVLLFARLGSGREFTTHEAHIVENAREMNTTGDWLVPRIAGEPWLEKPPLPQWSIAASGLAFGGIDTFSARVPSALAGLAGVLAFAALAARFRGPTTGMLAGLVLASSYYLITYARLAESDVYLWAVVVGAMAVFARSHVKYGSAEAAATLGWRSWAAFAFFVLVGVSQVVKGIFFGPALILAPVAAWLLIHRGDGWRWLVSPQGWACAAAVGFAWPVAVLAAHPEALDLWTVHTVGRLDSATAFNAKPAWYYLTTLPWQLMPWTLFVLPALPGSLRRAWREPGSLDRFLWVWFLSMFALLSAPGGKHHHYLIHALPPFALWTAEALPWWRDRVASLWSNVWCRLGAAGLIAAGVAGATRLVGEKYALPVWEPFAVAGVVILGGALAGRSCVRRSDVAAAASLFAVVAAGLLYATGVWIGRNDGCRPDADLLRRVNDHTRPGEAVVIFRHEPSRPLLYIDRPTVVADTPDELRAACAERPGCHVVTTELSEPVVRELLRGERVDETPGPRKPGDPGTRLVVFRTAR